MKRILLTITTLLGFMALGNATTLAVTGRPIPQAPSLPATTHGTTDTTGSTTDTKTALEQQHLTNLQTRGDAQIQMRLATLNKLFGLITEDKHLATASRTSLSDEVTTELTGLKALQTKLDAETTSTAALIDVQSIFTEFRVYALVDPKVRLVRTADDQAAVETKLTALATKLEARINAAQAAGKKVTTLQGSLTDLKTKLAASTAISSPIGAKVIALLPSDYNADHTILSGNADQLKTAHTDNVAAFNDAQSIITGLKSL
jgi:hypothetical protein